MKLRNGWLLSLLLVVLLAWHGRMSGACAASAEPEPGVPQWLARQRAASIADVAYELVLIVPDSLSQPVRGTIGVTFAWRGGKADVLLDFQGAFSGRCTVNGHRRRVAYVNEHIVIPARWLRRGNNRLQLDFECSDLALNRSRDYLYTLFVPDHARSCYPCFDQPDLKARFRVSLHLPDGWTSLCSDSLRPLPTYLSSFVAGRFQCFTAQHDGRQLTLLHRETDSLRLAQLPVVAELMARSIRWMERYTDIAMPFSSYGAVVLPGFQFGGMEHPGAIQLTDRRIFLPAHPTPDEERSRLNLIAHETAHLWFGDLVTMQWFDDVWTKEVFANFMAAKLADEQLRPSAGEDEGVDFLKSYYLPALSTDRTPGTHPIQQHLPNLNQASLLYGNIIYDKAPLMMRKLEQLMGEEQLRWGLQTYLRRYSFANATWDDLVSILDSLHPGVEQFSHAWVKQAGLPTISCTYEDGQAVVRQHDPLGRNLCWPQDFQVGLLWPDSSLCVLAVSMRDSVWRHPLAAAPLAIVPNFDGSGYGRFALPSAAPSLMPPDTLLRLPAVHRYAWMMTLYENYLMGRFSAADGLAVLLSLLEAETAPLVGSTCCSYIGRMLSDVPAPAAWEQHLLRLADSHALPAVRQHLLRLLAAQATEPAVLERLYAIWQGQTEPLLSEADYTQLSYRLAMARPSEWQQILAVQRSRLTNADRLHEFDFVSRGCTPSAAGQDSLFASLLQARNRSVEPWATRLLGLLCSRLREPYNNKYIADGLRVLPDVQLTGGIFFPANWLAALLGSHRSAEARREVADFLRQHPEMEGPLRRKVEERAYYVGTPPLGRAIADETP